MISDLPVELQNKIFFYAAEHPCATIIRRHIEITNEEEEEGLFCRPSNVLSELSNVFPDSCDYCKNNDRVIDGWWLVRIEKNMCKNCLKDEEITKLYSDEFEPDY